MKMKISDLEIKSIKKVETTKADETVTGYTTILTGEGTKITVTTKTKPDELVAGEACVMSIEQAQAKL